MNKSLDVDLDLIERILGRVLAELRANNGSVVPLDADFYWSIPSDRLTEVFSDPPKLGIGQVSECLEWLERESNAPDNLLPHHLIVLSDVLRVLGASAGPRSSVLPNSSP